MSSTASILARVAQNDPSLTILNLSNGCAGFTSLDAHKKLAHALRRNSNVHVVFLNNANLTAASMRALAPALSCNSCSIKFLYVSYNPLGDEGAVVLAEALGNNNGQHSKIEVLHCTDCDIGPRGALALVHMLTRNRSLHTIDLDNNSDRMLRHSNSNNVLRELAQTALPQNETLEFLSLRSNGYQNYSALSPKSKQEQDAWWRAAFWDEQQANSESGNRKKNTTLTTLRLQQDDDDDNNNNTETEDHSVPLSPTLQLGLALNRAGRHAWGDLTHALWPRLLAKAAASQQQQQQAVQVPANNNNNNNRNSNRNNPPNVLFAALRARPDLLTKTRVKSLSSKKEEAADATGKRDTDTVMDGWMDE